MATTTITKPVSTELEATKPEQTKAAPVEEKELFPTFAQVPKFDSFEEHRKWMLEHMAGAFRAFARRGYGVGSAGHISVRDPENPHTFWLNPLGRHFGTLKASDMVLVDYEGEVIGGSRLPVNKAGFKIHSAIHKARPDIVAACHTHSTFGKAYSAFGRPLEMLNQDACVFYNNQSIHHNFGGIVLTEDEGDRIAEAMGNTWACILQNHGLLTAGHTVDEAAALFMLMEQTCEVQLLADASQYPKKIIPHEQAQYTFDATFYPDLMYAEFLPDLEYEEFKDPSYKN